MKKSFVVYVILGAFILVAIITNPNQDRHKEVLRNKLSEYMQKNLQKAAGEEQDEWSKAGLGFGMLFGDVIIDRVINNLVTTDNYLVLSVTKITVKGETRVIGIGAFGNVYLTGKLDEALSQEMKQK